MYKLSKRAEQDFVEIYDYTFITFGEAQADLYTEQMETALQMLAKSPLLGRDCSSIKQGIRRFDVQKHSIYFRERAFDIFVIRILHQQMNPQLHIEH